MSAADALALVPDLKPEPTAGLMRAGGPYDRRLIGDPVEHVVETVRRWHNEAHTGGWATCREQPCHAVGIAAEDTEYMRPEVDDDDEG